MVIYMMTILGKFYVPSEIGVYRWQHQQDDLNDRDVSDMLRGNTCRSTSSATACEANLGWIVQALLLALECFLEVEAQSDCQTALLAQPLLTACKTRKASLRMALQTARCLSDQ